jgi:DNA gyrase subunit A
MPLRRLANLERQKILDEYAEVIQRIAYLEELLASPRRILILVQEEVAELKSKYADPRRTEIQEQGVIEFSEEDLIPHQRMVVTLSKRGFVKRVPSQVYRVQHRGGKGIIGMVTREQDAVRLLVVADTHDRLYFFTNRGKVFCLKCHEIPADSSRTGKGMAVINLFPVAEGERVTAMVAVSDFKRGDYLVMVTCGGEVKKTAVGSFAQVRSSGLIAMDLAENDELCAANLASDQDDIVLVTRKGQSIKFAVSELRASLRTSGGVRGIRLAPDDRVVSMGVAYPDTYLLVVTTNGFGKLTPVGAYPRQHRAGSGVLTFKVVEKTGEVIDAKVVSKSQQLMLISAEGIIMLTLVGGKEGGQGIAIQGRNTQGVRLMRPGEGDQIVAIACFE